MSIENARTLLSEAKDLLDWPEARTAGLWPRASALLARQALEHAMDNLWEAKAPSVARAPVRAQLLCLDSYLDNEEVADDARFAWGVLSAACHHHPYELAPTASELSDWLAKVERVMSSIETHLRSSTATRPVTPPGSP